MDGLIWGSDGPTRSSKVPALALKSSELKGANLGLKVGPSEPEVVLREPAVGLSE